MTCNSRSSGGAQPSTSPALPRTRARTLPIEDSVCAAFASLKSAHTRAQPDDSWPRARFAVGDHVIFREDRSSEPLAGSVSAVHRSRGDWAPRGVYYDVECSGKLATVAFVPDGLVRPWPGKFPRRLRPALYWNVDVGGGSIRMTPIGKEEGVVWLDGSWKNGMPDAHDHLLSLVEEDFDIYLYDIFDSLFGAHEPFNARRNAREPWSVEEGFDRYGENFFGLGACREAMAKTAALAWDDKRDFYARFTRLFGAVAEKAGELGDDAGVLVIGP